MSFTSPSPMARHATFILFHLILNKRLAAVQHSSAAPACCLCTTCQHHASLTLPCQRNHITLLHCSASCNLVRSSICAASFRNHITSPIFWRYRLRNPGHARSASSTRKPAPRPRPQVLLSDQQQTLTLSARQGSARKPAKAAMQATRYCALFVSNAYVPLRRPAIRA